jgi:phage baseplate assembly protein W
LANDPSKAYLGSGLAFPFQIDPRGAVLLAHGEEDIRQSIYIVLGTRPGERIMRPTFGCRVHELVFEPQDATTASRVETYVKEALDFWEPRITVLSVVSNVDPENDGTILVQIQYEVKSTHDVRSIVYPFYLAGEEAV